MEKTSIIEKVKEETKVTFKNLPFIFLIILTFILTGLTELIKPGFDWRVFITPSYWFNTVLVAVSGFLISISSAIMRANSIRIKDVDGKFAEVNKALSVVTPKIQDSTLDSFITEVNRERKIKAYKRKLEKEFYKLEKKLTVKEEIEYTEFWAKNSEIEGELKSRYSDEKAYSDEYYKRTLLHLKNCSKRVQKKVMCLLKMNESYIQENID